MSSNPSRGSPNPIYTLSLHTPVIHQMLLPALASVGSVVTQRAHCLWCAFLSTGVPSKPAYLHQTTHQLSNHTEFHANKFTYSKNIHAGPRGFSGQNQEPPCILENLSCSCLQKILVCLQICNAWETVAKYLRRMSPDNPLPPSHTFSECPREWWPSVGLTHNWDGSPSRVTLENHSEGSP